MVYFATNDELFEYSQCRVICEIIYGYLHDNPVLKTEVCLNRNLIS